ncbi:MAG: hypothetical protein BGP23_14055 [Lysobacterales bacterium 66-474]|nr:MAG: hypothetical protein ABT18_09955 [Rhodanobacter sp. SCN 66-43]OJY83753.1 MAG: hypothetical protein BGP23_14055 [Xanthomonadales bacterium 66-474]
MGGIGANLRARRRSGRRRCGDGRGVVVVPGNLHHAGGEHQYRQQRTAGDQHQVRATAAARTGVIFQPCDHGAIAIT